MKLHLPLHIHILTLFLILVLLVGGLIGGLGYKMSSNMLESAASDLIGRIGKEMNSEVRHTISPGETAANILSHSAITNAATFKERMERLGLMREVLNSSDALASIYVGYNSGDFFLLRRLRDDADRRLFNAPPDSRYLLQSIERRSNPPRGRYIYLDAKLKILREDNRPDYAAGYDPRKRDWYKDVLVSDKQIKSPPYIFFSSKKIGITISNRAEGGKSVVGADIGLETLSDTLGKQIITPGSQVVLLNRQGFVIAHKNANKLISNLKTPDGKPRLSRIEDLGIPVLTALSNTIKPLERDPSRDDTMDFADDNWRVIIQPIQLQEAEPLYLIMAIPDRELLAGALELRSISLLITCLLPLK